VGRGFEVGSVRGWCLGFGFVGVGGGGSWVTGGWRECVSLLVEGSGWCIALFGCVCVCVCVCVWV